MKDQDLSGRAAHVNRAKTNYRLAGCVLVTVVLSVLSSARAATTIYSAPFTNSSGADASVNSLGANWAAYYYGSPAVDTSASTAYVLDANASGSDLSTIGYIRFNYSPSGSATGRDRYALVNTGLNLSLSQGDTISWNSVGNVSQTHVQLLIQLEGGQWYLSNTDVQILNGGLNWSNANAKLNSMTFSTAASGWSSFTLSSMSIGASLSEDLPSTTITGIGLYTYNLSASGTSSFIDNLTITTTVPEPGTHALLLLGALAGIASRGRARRQ